MTAINAKPVAPAISAYSIAVAPSSFFMKWAIDFLRLSVTVSSLQGLDFTLVQTPFFLRSGVVTLVEVLRGAISMPVCPVSHLS
jgi:hypothetical protein